MQDLSYSLTQDAIRAVLGFERLPNQNEVASFANGTNDNLTAMDVTDKIERLEVFEERSGIRFESLYAHFDDNGWLNVHGELHPMDGIAIEKDIQVVCAIYDNANRVLDQKTEYINAQNFFGFELFNHVFYKTAPESVTKIRLFPKTW